MTDRDKAIRLENEANAMLERYCAMADAIYADVAARFH